MSLFNYKRRQTRPVRVGSKVIGGEAPILLQSMTNVSTNDVQACVEQIERLANAGADLVRLTTQGVREAESLAQIRSEVRARGIQLPLSADVHFNPAAATAAASRCEKVRINPGNFADAARTFRTLEFTEEEYAGEIEKIRSKLIPFLALCREQGTAVRLGVNHGSLSDRIMSRFGDTPQGMVESVMEYLRIAREADFHDIVISIKASNTVVMTQTVRLLVQRMEAEGMDYPLHIGVTEAGDAEDGRIKSAVGIGSLLAEGLGDTIRVSLSEEPECEIPVARTLAAHIASRLNHTPIPEPPVSPRFLRHPECAISVNADYKDIDSLPQDWAYEDASSRPSLIDATVIVLTSSHANAPGEIMSWIQRYRSIGGMAKIIVRYSDTYASAEDLRICAAADLGTILLSGFAEGIWIESPSLSAEELKDMELSILQAVRLRISKTEYIACPGCGRTLFDLQGTLKRVKEATSHLKGVKIAVMGCIVNGPGEMADADYGYVGAASGRVSLYKGKQCVEKNIPQEEALDHLLALIEKTKISN